MRRSRSRPRPAAEEIYESVQRDAAQELVRSAPGLAFSGAFAGGTVGFSGLAAASAMSMAGDAAFAPLLGALFYPIGFVAAIIGRAQLFTENTLYPVTLVLDRPRYLGSMLRLWAIVLGANLLGAFGFALFAAFSGAISPPILDQFRGLGEQLSAGGWMENFWSGVAGGWLLALVAWVSEASDATIARVALIWTLTFVISVAGFDHCISTTVEVLAAVLHGDVSVARLATWFSAVVLGNIAGGVVLVGLINYGQVRAGKSREEDPAELTDA